MDTVVDTISIVVGPVLALCRVGRSNKQTGMAQRQPYGS